MCYHTGAPSKAELKNKYSKKKIIYDNPKEIFHISGFERPFLPVTLNQDPESIVPARWKLIPFWVKTENDASKYVNTLNAEGESIFEKASYKNYILNNRGLLYSTGFFEPHKVSGQKETDNYFIYEPNHNILTLGIVFAQFLDQETGETYPTFSIITTEGNSLLKKIHNVKERMPLIIPPEKQDEWLFSKDKQAIQQLIIPYQGELGSHKVFRVTGARNVITNSPDIQKPI